MFTIYFLDIAFHRFKVTSKLNFIYFFINPLSFPVRTFHNLVSIDFDGIVGNMDFTYLSLD